MKNYVCLLLIHVFSGILYGQNSECENIDFEEGTLAGWTTAGDVELVQATQTDPYGGFPLAMSGNYAIQLGNNVSPVMTSPYYSSITRDLTITEDNKFFLYAYSIVLLGYPHPEDLASYVELTVQDSLGNDIPCTNYIVYAESGAGNGFFQSTAPPEANIGGECCYYIYYKPWQLTALDLTPYIGQTLTFRMVSDWCYYDVDWGYSYVDVFCSSNLMNAYTCSDGTTIVSSIPGFESYAWTGPGIISGQGTYQITIDQPGTYGLTVPNPNSGCSPISIEQEVEINTLNSILNADFLNTTNFCIGDTVEFVNISEYEGFLAELTWSFGDGDSSQDFSTSHIYPNPGTYNVELFLQDQFGCVDSIMHSIQVANPPVLELGDDQYICDGKPTDIFPEQVSTNVSYNWSTGSTDPFVTVSSPQTVFLTVSNGCERSDSLDIYINPSYFGNVPNVITANYDQVNDYFSLDYFDIEEFSLIIYNRWGERVFETADPAVSWNGTNLSGNLLHEGVYFYLLNYRLSCEEETVQLSGHVTLVR